MTLSRYATFFFVLKEKEEMRRAAVTPHTQDPAKFGKEINLSKVKREMKMHNCEAN